MPRAHRFYGVVQLLVAFFLCAGALYAALDRRYRDGIILLLLSIPLVSYALRSFGKLAPRAVEVPERVAADYRLEISEQALRFDDTSVRISKLGRFRGICGRGGVDFAVSKGRFCPNHPHTGNVGRTANRTPRVIA